MSNFIRTRPGQRDHYVYDFMEQLVSNFIIRAQTRPRQSTATLIRILTFVLMLRILWSFVLWFRADFEDPIVQVVRVITNAIISISELVSRTAFPDTPTALSDLVSGVMRVFDTACVCVLLTCFVCYVGVMTARFVELGRQTFLEDIKRDGFFQTMKL